ncbi:unnamed protein product [Ostreobium quekettii]|uniref:Hydroxylysine kinase n=1 Tax=Ostreobium quekettii TaxID=121088 RepID=A0A8S1J8U3_9CHLO|nr:unnamed protein product [Ostreobium quekettii]
MHRSCTWSVYLEVADELANVLRHVGDTLPRQLVHTDANESNVLVDESDTQILGIIDFGEMNVGHRAMDVAHAMAYQMAFSRGDRMEPAVCILKGYLSVNPLLPTEIDVLPVMIMGRMAQSIVLGAYSAAQDPSNESYIMDGKDGMWAVVQHIREVGPGKMADMLKAAVQSENENVES